MKALNAILEIILRVSILFPISVMAAVFMGVIAVLGAIIGIFSPRLEKKILIEMSNNILKNYKK